MRRLAVLTAAVVAACGALTLSTASAAPDTQVRPGYWKYQARIAMIPVSTQYKCLKADEIERFLFNPCTRHYRCTYPTKVVGGGRVSLQGVWTDKRGREAPVRASGSYTETSVRMNANVRTIHGIPVSGVMEGTWVSDACPAG